VASPNPEGDKHDDNPAAETKRTNTQKYSRTRETSGLRYDERTFATIRAAADQHRAKEESYWNRQVFWQWITALATIAAFAAAAVYAYLAHEQVQLTSDSLRLTQRAYVNVSPPIGDALGGTIVLPIDNTGRLPASPSKITTYTAREKFPVTTVIAVCRATGQNTLGIPPGRAVQFIDLPLPSWHPSERAAVQQRAEAIFIAVEISYGDGFADDGTIVYQWCSQTSWQDGKLLWGICQDGQIEWLKNVTKEHSCQ
jgi:hypothetical protein